MGRETLSWGRAHRFHQDRVAPSSIEEARSLLLKASAPVLAHGLGRSYGDSCLNEGGLLIDTTRLDHFIAFDEEAGEIECEAGVSLAALIDLLMQRQQPDGSYWFPAVVPGTRFVTVGGAIANDVHGKNHEVAGTFGAHIRWLDLLRSDGSLLRCSAEENAGLFGATIGGLGLTGLIVRARLKLKRVPGLVMEVENVRLRHLDDYRATVSEDEGSWTHRAAWVDVLARGRGLGRGIYTRARFVEGSPRAKAGGLTVPLDGPDWLIGPTFIRLFNAAYRRKLLGRSRQRSLVPFLPVLFPLDALGGWNRLYGRNGFFQHQSVLPPETAIDGIEAMLASMSDLGQGSFLAVLKEFGPAQSPGLMSFPMAGSTLAVDFQNRGASTRRLLKRLDDIVAEGRGRLYAAKDGHSAAGTFAGGYPGLEAFKAHLDPGFSSSFWRRIHHQPA